MQKNIIIKIDNDLELRSWKKSLALALFQLVSKNRKHLINWMPWAVNTKTVKDSEKFILDSLGKQKEDKSLEMGIWHKNILVGCMGIHNLDLNNRRTSLGYWLDVQRQGQGLVTRSAKALIQYCFNNLKLNRIGLETAVNNQKSIAVAKRLGFIKEGVLREFELVNKRFLDYIVFSLLKKD